MRLRFRFGRELEDYLGTEVAPVGDWMEGLDLYLTANGQIIGKRDFILYRWGLPDFHWQASIKLILAGALPEQFATMPHTNSD